MTHDTHELLEPWNDEIARRVREVMAGRLDAVPFDEAMAQVRQAIERERSRPEP